MQSDQMNDPSLQNYVSSPWLLARSLNIQGSITTFDERKHRSPQSVKDVVLCEQSNETLHKVDIVDDSFEYRPTQSPPVK